jgi:hypothetical protein
MNLFVAYLLFFLVADADKRLCVCHIEHQDSKKGHVLEVDQYSIVGHLKHGDVQCNDCSRKGKHCSHSAGPSCTE